MCTDPAHRSREQTNVSNRVQVANKPTKFLKETKFQVLNYVPLDLDSSNIVLLAGTLFANSEGMKNQLG